MIYLISIKKYLFTFLKVLIFVVVILLLYFLEVMTYEKYAGNPNFITSSIVNYLTVLFFSLPFLQVASTVLFFGFSITFDKLLLYRILPIIGGINAVLLIVFFVVDINFQKATPPKSFAVPCTIHEGHINPVNQYNIYVINMLDTKIREGMLFYKNTYFINSGKIQDDRIILDSSKAIGAGGVYNKNSHFSIPINEPVVRLPESGISSFLINSYLDTIQRIRHIFKTAFFSTGLFVSILAILLLSVGFFGIVGSVSFFMNEKQIYILSTCALVVVSFLFYYSLPYFLSLVEVIKLGIKSPFGSLFLPSLFVGIFAGLIGFGLLQLKDILIKRSKGAM